MSTYAERSASPSPTADRGRSATRPREIPAKGWKDILYRLKDELNKDNVSIVAAGVAFYGLLAIVPALAALVFIYGIVADPQDVQQQLNALGGMLPQQARDLLNQQLSKITAHSRTALSAGAIGGLLLTLWSAAKGMKTLMEALNVAYDEEEDRGFIKLNLTALALTLGAILLGVVATALVVAVPVLFGGLGLGDTVKTWVSVLRWPVLAVFVILGLAVVYHYGPDRSRPRWQWVSWGAVVATVLWIIASIGFAFYVRNFGSYNETYGSMGAVIVLLMWFFITAYIVLLGAELNAELEHQTTRDTTKEGNQPLGRRGAYAADTVGATASGDDSEQEELADAERQPAAAAQRTGKQGAREALDHETPSVTAAATVTEPRRLPPDELLEQAWAYLREGSADDYIAGLGRTVKRHPLPAVLMGVGLAWLMLRDITGNPSSTEPRDSWRH